MRQAMELNNYPGAKGYLDTAGTGLLGARGLNVSTDFLNNLHSTGSKAFFDWRQNRMPVLFAEVARLFGAYTNEIAFVPNFSYGQQALISGFSPETKVLIASADYPSLTLPIHLGGFQKIVIDEEFGEGFLGTMLDAIAEHKPDVVIVSHVQFKSGYTMDLEALSATCKHHGALSVVDCTQSLGAIPLDFKTAGIDVVLASSYKWLNGGFGSGIALVKPRFFERFTPTFGGFGSFVMEDGQLVFNSGIRSLEPGHQAYASLCSLEAALKEKLEFGMEEIFQHNSALSSELIAGLESLGLNPLFKGTHNELSPISVFKCQESLQHSLIDNGIRCSWRDDHLRLSLHFYNSSADVEMVLEKISQLTKGAPELIHQ